MTDCPLCRVSVVPGMNDPAITDEMVERAAVATYRWQWDSDDDLSAIDVGEAADYRALARVVLETLTESSPPSVQRECGLLMVGSGTDVYDPICELPGGHHGPCKSSAAVDQHRLDPSAFSGDGK